MKSSKSMSTTKSAVETSSISAANGVLCDSRIPYMRPQIEVYAVDSQQMIAGTVRTQGSDWEDGGEETIEFNFESPSGAKGNGIVSFSDLWDE